MKEKNVLILDDEKNILESLKRLLRNEPFDLSVTTSYAEAFKIMKGGKIKVVISDQRMPEISGVEFLRRIKERYPDTIRILFTGFADMKVAEEAINKGEVYRFINKPWDNKALETTVRDAIEKFDLSDRNRRLTEEIKKSNGELTALNMKLKNMYEAQKDFSSTVSHELRTPLASIKTAIDIVISGTTGGLTPGQNNFLSKAKANVDRLSRLIDDILSLSKLESGKSALSLRKGDINTVIREVAEIQRPVAEKKGLFLKTAPASGMPAIPIDSDKMNQVLSNLVNNAIKFTDKGGIVISNTADLQGNYIEVRVKDTGPGVRDEDKAKLFEKFQQLGDHATRKEGGTGLGLAICREIISRHGGKIWVESEFGKGSAFCFLLPIEERRGGARGEETA